MTDRIFYADGESPVMQAAFLKAQNTFKYFWRELSWENRRVVPALGIQCAKVAFTQEAPNGFQIVEHMWINEVYFDGEQIYGVLLNQPNDVTNVEQGDRVAIPLSQLSDWMFSCDEITYGGFTIHAMRSEMDPEELKEHDEAWGLNFGDFNEILVAYQEKEHPENLIEHPMSRNMGDSFKEFLAANPDQVQSKNASGNTLLHAEAIAGNLTLVELLVAAGAPIHAKNEAGKTALQYAQELEWAHISSFLTTKSGS